MPVVRGGQVPKTGRARAAAAPAGTSCPQPAGGEGSPARRGKWARPQNGSCGEKLAGLATPEPPVGAEGAVPWALPGSPGHRSAALSVALGPLLCLWLTALGHRGLLSVHATREGVADPGSRREVLMRAQPPGTVYALSRSPSPGLSHAASIAARSSEKRQEMLCGLASVT